MSKAPINIKNLRTVSDDGMTWMYDETDGNIGKIVVFPTEKAFLDALVENGQIKEEYEKYMKSNAEDLKECLEVLGSKEQVIKYIHNDLGDELQEEMEEELPNIQCIFFDFVDYCIVSGLHYDEVTVNLIHQLFYAAGSIEDENDYIFIDKDAEDKIWFMSDVEELGYYGVLYKLSADEQELLKKQLAESDCRLMDCELYIKACSLVLDEILELFAE